MTGMPDAVKVGPWLYTVVTDPELIAKAAEGNVPESGAWEAFSDHQQLVIGVDTTHSEAALRVSVLHEILHCCLRVAGCWPSQYARVLARARHEDSGVDIEEFVIAGTSATLLSVLRDNPNLLAWLTDGEPS